MTDFKVEPASKKGGGHPNVTITQVFGYGSDTDDSAKDAFVRLQPGLLGNPQNAAFCSQQQFSSDSCPANSTVGSVVVTAHTTLLPFLPLPNPGTVYNLRPTGTEPARVGIAVDAAAGLTKIFLQAPVFIRPGPDGYGLESTFANQPRTAGLPIQIEKIALTFNGQASKGPFMRMPTSCAEGTSLSRANSWDAPTVFSERTFKMTPIDCGALGFQPTASGAMGAPGATSRGAFPPVETTLSFDPEEAALSRAEVTLPSALSPNLAAVNRACTRAQADASACPDRSRVGTAIIDSPLQPQPVRGPVYIAFNTDAPLPGLVVILPAPVGVRLDGAIEIGAAGIKNTFAGNPDLPVRSFTLALDQGEASGALSLNRDLCDEDTDRTMSVTLFAHNGKLVSFERELATPGCDPRAKLTIRRRGRRATLVARLTAARAGPGMTSFGIRLPKTTEPRQGATARACRRARIRPSTRRRLVSAPFPGEVRRRPSPGEACGRGRLRRVAGVRVRLTDARGYTTRLAARAGAREAAEAALARP